MASGAVDTHCITTRRLRIGERKEEGQTAQGKSLPLASQRTLPSLESVLFPQLSTTYTLVSLDWTPHRAHTKRLRSAFWH
jgi:hypothetical protein